MSDKKIRAAVITSSDSGYQGIREDVSGPEIKKLLEQSGYEITAQILLPDEQDCLSEKMKELCDKGTADLIITTGGTGFSERDRMPEATKAIIERE
ncbi:MAG TPA: molybdopterin-binding protein, partial [Lachnospiraceae bacterium]|nr:molybdopterin-binding protein [Lachnospiraceae bacterium]